MTALGSAKVNDFVIRQPKAFAHVRLAYALFVVHSTLRNVNFRKYPDFSFSVPALCSLCLCGEQPLIEFTMETKRAQRLHRDQFKPGRYQISTFASRRQSRVYNAQGFGARSLN